MTDPATGSFCPSIGRDSGHYQFSWCEGYFICAQYKSLYGQNEFLYLPETVRVSHLSAHSARFGLRALPRRRCASGCFLFFQNSYSTLYLFPGDCRLDYFPNGCLPAHIDARAPARPVDERSRPGGAEDPCCTRSFIRDPGRIFSLVPAVEPPTTNHLCRDCTTVLVVLLKGQRNT